ncbi:hypothetical protein NMG60_11035970 [Bertholletia excelsa]
MAEALLLHGSSSGGGVEASMGISQYCVSLLEALPLPEATWSTTEPSVLVTPPTPPRDETTSLLEFEWAEQHLASSSAWWRGFLESLDGNINNYSPQVYPEYSREQNGSVFKGINGKCPQSPSDAINDQQNSALDDWLTVPGQAEMI